MNRIHTNIRVGLLIVFVISLIGCGKTLPAEEQKRLQEEANARKIQRVTENEMIAFVQEKGELLEDMISNDIESSTAAISEELGSEYPVNYLKPQEATTNELNELMEAYMFSIAAGEKSQSNLQVLDNGDIMYTIPHVEDSSGITVLRGLWKIEFVRKNMVNQISRQAD